MSNIHQYTNRLIHEKSPYLLQHAHNPVNWYPWGDEAFAEAKKGDKPIFLSIGYSTCHWCHVMERESFENEEIANLLNEAFINIKIDREELPHIDSLYMEFAQSMMLGASGWPLNVILTPDLKPFFAATYLPPQNKKGLMGLSELAKRIHEVWYSDERENIVGQADKILELFMESVHTNGDDYPSKEQVREALELIFKLSDPMYGGLRGAPKFPVGYQANFFMHCYETIKEGRALFMAEKTLDMMQRGGIYDHLGGGFSRYSVDQFWLVPHFEKMLYDNALLIFSYIEAWQITKKPLYQEICEEIISYIMRDMQHSEGGFYSAEDADSDNQEGIFYTWQYDEIENILGKEQSTLFCEYYQLSREGNFGGRNILHIKTRIEEFAKYKKLDPQALTDQFNAQKKILWKAREMHHHPFKDDKILTSWNGLMIYALVQAGCAFGKQDYIDCAVNAAKFIKTHLWKDPILLRRWREDEAMFDGGLEEYAFLIHGLISLFEAGCGIDWLTWALQLTDILSKKFKAKQGAFYQTDEAEKNVILRKTQFADGAEPSGNAVHCENLLRLYQLTMNQQYLDEAEDIIRAVKKFIDTYPPGYCYSLMNLNRYYDEHASVLVVALGEDEKEFQAIRQAIYRNFIPHKGIIWKRKSDQTLETLIPYVKNLASQKDEATLYLCKEGSCQRPVTGMAEIIQTIEKL
jgi:uncharacterized protein